MIEKSDVSEFARLAALRAFGIQSGKQIPSLNHISRVAMDHFKVPTALVSIVEEDEQIFAGCTGLDIPGTPRDQAFCNYTIQSNEVFIVEDATRDPRFSANPLVTGKPHIRFYAGAPLVLDGNIRLGAICLIDYVPRSLNLGQRIVLKHLASIALQEITKLRESSAA